MAARSLDGEMMIMSASDSTLFTLNETATLVWEAADGSTSLEEIVAARVCLQFDVEYQEALRDAEVFAKQLASHGILLLRTAPIADTGAPGERASS